MAKWYLLTCLIIILSKYEYQVCTKKAFSKLDDAIGYTSSAIGIKSFTESFLDTDLQKDTFEHVMDEIRILNLQLTYTFRFIMETISEIPKIIIYLQEEKDILKHFSRVGEIFRISMRNKFEIAESVGNTSIFKLSNQNYNRMLDNSMMELRRILLNANTTSFLTKNYDNANKKYYNVCKTNMTQLQALDHVLGLVETVFDQYYDVKVFMLETISSAKTDIEYAKSIIRENVASDFESLAIEFKKMMSLASREFWKCDPTKYAGYNGGRRYEYKPGSPYYELQQATTYIAENEQKQSCANKKKPEKCREGVNSNVCKLSRPCKGEFLECTHMHPHTSDRNIIAQGYYLCMNGDKDAYARYHHIGDANKETFDCAEYTAIAYRYSDESNLDFCDCLCHENIYFFDESNVFSDYANNKIVTGARLAVENNTIHIQIQEAEVLPNGVFKKGNDPLVWKKPEKMKRLNEYQKQHILESVDLTEINNLPTDKVITGFTFEQSLKTKRVKLLVMASSYDFRTGKVSGLEPNFIRPDDAVDEYKLIDEDVPIYANQETKPLSNNKQYVSFTITSLKKDGGQTTIPFIDTQNVETKIPTPLSGAGLYLRGQPGFAGFLALKLYTYDVTPYVDLNLAEETF